jgi:SAM-dependent methyltransferase
MKKNQTIQADWYDYPQYYDIAFRSETRLEADFIEAACRKYGKTGQAPSICASSPKAGQAPGIHDPEPVPFSGRLLEPACGTGRLVAELAARGYRVTGLDLSEPSLNYLRRRLARRRLSADVFRADMADFRLDDPVDAAYCTFDGFRHLLSEDAARRHLQCVADALRPGGIYVLGFHLLPPDADEECTERWTEQHGQTRVTVTLRVLATDRRRRIETLRVCLLVRSGQRTLRLRHDFPFRMYTAAQFRRLLKQVPSLELCDVYDFWYEIDHPLKLNDEISDTVFILRKRVVETNG